MKTLTIYAVILFSLFSLNSFAQHRVKKESIKVWGNCGMCRKTIETAAKSGGATYANWNQNTKILKITYNSHEPDSKKIQKAIAASGYDTQNLAADNGAYSRLDECCKYPRKKIINSLN